MNLTPTIMQIRPYVFVKDKDKVKIIPILCNRKILSGKIYKILNFITFLLIIYTLKFEIGISLEMYGFSCFTL